MNKLISYYDYREGILKKHNLKTPWDLVKKDEFEKFIWQTTWETFLPIWKLALVIAFWAVSETILYSLIPHETSFDKFIFGLITIGILLFGVLFYRWIDKKFQRKAPNFDNFKALCNHPDAFKEIVQVLELFRNKSLEAHFNEFSGNEALKKPVPAALWHKNSVFIFLILDPAFLTAFKDAYYLQSEKIFFNLADLEKLNKGQVTATAICDGSLTREGKVNKLIHNLETMADNQNLKPSAFYNIIIESADYIGIYALDKILKSNLKLTERARDDVMCYCLFYNYFHKKGCALAKIDMEFEEYMEKEGFNNPKDFVKNILNKFDFTTYSPVFSENEKSGMENQRYGSGREPFKKVYEMFLNHNK